MTRPFREDSAFDAVHEALDDNEPEVALERLETLGRDHRIFALIARIEGLRGVALRALERPADALQAFERAASYHREESIELAEVFEDRAELDLDRGDALAAREHLVRAVAIRSRCDAPSAQAYLALSDAARRGGDRVLALEAAADAERLDPEGPEGALAAEFEGELLLAEDPARSQAAFRRAHDIHRLVGDEFGRARSLLGLAKLAELEDEESAVVALAQEIRGISLRAEERSEIEEVLSTLLP